MVKNVIIGIFGILLIACLYFVIIESAVSVFGKMGFIIGAAISTYYVCKIFKDKKNIK